jgi:hypothetical protein
MLQYDNLHARFSFSHLPHYIRKIWLQMFLKCGNSTKMAWWKHLLMNVFIYVDVFRIWEVSYEHSWDAWCDGRKKMKRSLPICWHCAACFQLFCRQIFLCTATTFSNVRKSPQLFNYPQYGIETHKSSWLQRYHWLLAVQQSRGKLLCVFSNWFREFGITV